MTVHIFVAGPSILLLKVVHLGAIHALQRVMNLPSHFLSGLRKLICQFDMSLTLLRKLSRQLKSRAMLIGFQMEQNRLHQNFTSSRKPNTLVVLKVASLVAFYTRILPLMR